jgi:hypothetical protein
LFSNAKEDAKKWNPKAIARSQSVVNGLSNLVSAAKKKRKSFTPLTFIKRRHIQNRIGRRLHQHCGKL